MRRMKRLLILLLVFVSVAALFANGAKEGSGATQGSKGTIGVVLITTADVNTVNAMNAFAALAQSEGWKVIQADSQGQQDMANSAIEGFVQQKVDGIVSTIYPPDALQAGIQAANQAGIPIVGHFSGDGAGLAAWSSSGDGEEMIRLMIKSMGGKGEVLALTYRPGKPALEREAVLDRVMAEFPNIRVTKQEVQQPDTLGTSAEAARGWLASRAVGKANYAIWGAWDAPCVGAVTALKELGRQDVRVYGYNADADAQGLIRDGWMTASTWFDNEKVGEAEYRVLINAIAAGKTWKKIQVPASVVVVTKENIDTWLSRHPEAAGAH